MQLAKDNLTSLEYAMKLFMPWAACDGEVALYSDPSNTLGLFLPAVRDVESNDDSMLIDGHGVPMPPCINMEKGKSLDMWSARNGDGVDMITALQACHPLQPPAVFNVLESEHTASVYPHCCLVHALWLMHQCA